jgi:hypothetical protein
VAVVWRAAVLVTPSYAASDQNAPWVDHPPEVRGEVWRARVLE